MKQTLPDPLPMLALKVPPPLLVVLLAAAMVELSAVAPQVELAMHWRVLGALPFGILGLAFMLAGVLAFRRARTTVDPLHPEEATALVTTGAYRISRNPMYVGFGFLLLAWAVWLASPPALLLLPVFVAYLNRYQIGPEERALEALFGPAYVRYRSTVRRWL
jgi:protein-S-isoprenylcysteine O-methyltransferase Ste14